jgi:cell division protein FtsI/penicillin-binding protein 2
VNRSRFWTVVIGIAIAVSVVVGRSVQIMIFQHTHWLDRARRQQEKIIEVPGARGSIMSADGYLLATSVDRYAVQVDTKILTHPDLFAQAVAPLAGCSEEDLSRRLNNGARSVWIAQQVDRARAEQIWELADNAVVLVPDSERIYPLGSIASPVVGFVGREELVTIGREGFEHHFDAYLSGEPHRYLAVSDVHQRRIRLERLKDRGGREGFDLRLTLHARLQAACEREMEAILESQRAKSVSAVVLEAHTGSILAIVSLPSFDPKRPGDTSWANWRLRPVQDAYEPGSVVKPLVAAVALSEGVVRRGERFDCREKGYRIAGRWMRDHATPGLYTLDEVVVESANAGMIEVAQRLDADALWRMFDAFGFGRKTGVGFPAESRGILPSVASWSGLSQASLALGQELTATPLQIAVAYGAIANGGWLVQPRLVASVADGRQTSPDRQQIRTRVLDPALSERLTSILETVVASGTGGEARLPGYRVAGKTGTAQRAVGGSFDDSHHVSWFAGFFPLPDPTTVVVVAVEEPTTDFWGSTVAAPAFSRLAQAVMAHLGVPPSEEIVVAEGGSA